MSDALTSDLGKSLLSSFKVFPHPSQRYNSLTLTDCLTAWKACLYAELQNTCDSFSPQVNC